MATGRPREDTAPGQLACVCGEVESRIAHGQLQGQQQLLKLAFMSRVYWKDRSCILRALGGLERSLMRARTRRGA